jgi:hydroxypyruvate isomerase
MPFHVYHGRVVRFAANLSTVFPRLPLLERPAAAVRSGFGEVELWWPFSAAVPPEREVAAFAQATSRAGIRVVLMNLYHGSEGDGELGLLSIPDQRGLFLDALEVAVDVAAKLGIPRLNALYGRAQPGLCASDQAEVAIANLRMAAEAAQAAGASIVIEPLNSVDNPGYPLPTTPAVLELVRQVNSAGGPAVGIQADTYHMGRMGEDASDGLRLAAESLGHIQFGDIPGRCEPGCGELDWVGIIQTLDEIRYDGYVGLEYVPDGDAESSLRRARAYLQQIGASYRDQRVGLPDG